jgi:8-oxo-dGTP pyrophosphatase MutT (NUDIX family)
MISKAKLHNFKKKFDVVSVFIEHEGEILLLHRHDSKPQGNTWSVPAGKVQEGEDLLKALSREVEEELGLRPEITNLRYFEKYYVRYPGYDYIYHVYHLQLKEKPSVNLNFQEHKNYIWIKPSEALKLDLIQDEDSSIKWFFNLST